MPTYSIIISTRNRCSDLASTLDSIGLLQPLEGETFETIIVDNGSTDRTAELVHSLAPAFPGDLRYLHHEEPGKLRALNAAWPLAKAELIAMTDDDVRFSQNWLQSITRPIREGRAVGAVGKIDFPEHLEKRFVEEPYRSIRGWFADSCYLKENDPVNLIGANMAVHRNAFEVTGGFDASLGPGALGFFDEVLFSWQLKAAGHKLATAFDAVVEHHFSPDRLIPAALLNHARNQGASYAYVFHHWNHDRQRAARLRLAQTRLLIGLRSRELSDAKSNLRAPSLRLLKLQSKLGFLKQILIEREKTPRYSRTQSNHDFHPKEPPSIPTIRSSEPS